MKKVLFATTALVLTAGVAAADVTVGGDGRMGVINDFGSDDLAFTSRIRISFAASGETDGGLSFGGSIRADNSGNGTAGTAGNVFVSGAFGKLSMGDVDGGAEQAVGDVSGVGLTGLGDHNETVYLNGDNDPTALYEYTTGDLSFYLSAGQPSAADSEYAVGAKYAPGMYTVGLGYENDDLDNESQILVSGSASFGDATVKAVYGTLSSDVAARDGAQYAVSLDYTMGATTGTLYYADREDIGDAKAYGLGASYDLGGGAALKGGYVRNQTTDEDAYDFGISMKF